ncbi:MAG: hypothetical protein A2504_17390 [Bdellovibrionales bacterium RIFOXYD12_FULL_39_22]|nr:MAG: hypothetical protein A2385_10570 [Bdellovibrionales bacterium RIFOXYB1_FULL_39_21]OFZ40780.1 MAG: hypothetical protein A2485_17160 [Bdellovibrionales bacterium RIFOXYC12_FULL_39_17]OFZ48202.1 MAG: hypothetical protein A2404_17320 [Bdellovibrionales bacterium RIFOXYC1_FULL_39_130]OFZ70631.1 MAG: hypothetical protein A2451_06870 [Bdellovibrionales bacterium RIFOXYC2_FULL_39_8]OFZ75852.1 MAG: hypothetical protein A2560_13820 [Bdellovibrionales bacterium RIFOXYD1_FULL_39_84]OFZ91913.1 MAG:
MSVKYLIVILILSVIEVKIIAAANNNGGAVTFEEAPLNEITKSEILEDKTFVESIVTNLEKDKKKIQTLKFHAAGLHKKSCTFALRKMSLYEKQKDYLSFVKESTYDEKSERINLLLSSPILPFNMILDFKIERITEPGKYNFVFDKGFLKDLKGEINASAHKDRCFFYVRADWVGPDTNFPNKVFEFFSSTLGKLGIDNMFRVSTIWP